MPLDGGRCAAAARRAGAELRTGRAALPRPARPVPGGASARAGRSRWPAPRRRRSSRRRPRRPAQHGAARLRQRPGARRLVGARPPRPGRRWRRCWPPPRCRCRRSRWCRLKSEGMTLVLGRDEVALAAAERLRDRLDLTVLLTGEQPVEPPRSAEYPILRGRARAATGWLGAFEVVVDGYAAPSPSSRGAYRWGPARDGARSRCDLILDLSGGAPLFPARGAAAGLSPRRPGRRGGGGAGRVRRRRAGGRVRQAALRVLRRRALRPQPQPPHRLHALPRPLPHRRHHARARTAWRSRREICAGCGACSAVCPTGAATYALPPPADDGRAAAGAAAGLRRGGRARPAGAAA